MDVRVVLTFAMTMLVAIGSSEAGEVRQQGGREVWISQACERPLAPAVEKGDAQALNQSVNRYNRYVAVVDDYNQCLSEEAARDIERFVGLVNESVRSLQDEAIAGVEVERAALASGKP